jgi:PAS domain S-box-containing protein
VSAPTILVVEDNPITRNMFRVALEAEQFTVLEAHDGATALRLLATEHPALVLQDFVLPDMTGADLLKRIRRLHDASALPVVQLTELASGTAEFEEGGAFTTVLSKPVEPSRLLEVVRTLLAARDLPKRRAALPPRRVLVVDDDAANRTLMDALLKRAGYRPTVVASAEDALLEARRERPDAILADVLMPGQDGFQLCLAVRRDPELAAVPFVLVSSAYTDEADRKLAVQVGAFDLAPRTPGLEQAIAAIEAACAPGACVPKPTASDLDQEYLASMRRQIDRQLVHTQELARRAGIQAAALSMVGALVQALANPREVTGVLGDVLVHCLDAAGLSTGILYLRSSDSAMRVHSMAGLPDVLRPKAETGFGHPELLELDDAASPRAFNVAASNDAAECAFLSQLKRRSAMIVPFVVLARHYGTLVLASDVHDLANDAWRSFARALAAQFGQAVALAKSLSDLAESDALLRSAVEASPSGMVMSDASGRLVMVNRQVERMFGYDEGELLGRQIESLLPTRYRAAHVGHRAAFQADPRPRSLGAARELFGLHKDGREIPVEIGLAPVTRGQETLVIASVVDITERKNTEQTLRDREERFRQITEGIKEVFFVMDAQYRETLYISPAYEQAWGRSCQSLYDDPKSFLAPVPPEDRQRLLAYIGRVQQGEDTGEIEYRVVRPDGEVRWMLTHAVPVRNKQGDVYRISGAALDISKRKQVEEALRESEQRARTLFETVDLVVLGLDARGHVDYVNPFFLRITGYTREEVLGKNWLDFLPAALRSPMGNVLRELLEHESHPHYENPVVTKTGEERMISWNNTVLRDAAGRATGSLSVGEDVTQRQQLELQLRQAQKMEAVGRLAGGVAHDFNNVLTAVFGYVDLLREELGDNAAAQQDLAEIRKAAERAAGLTRQLLAFSRQQVLEPVVLALNDLVEDFEKMLRRVIGEDVELRLALGREVGNVRADPGQLHQVIMNLVVNSRDAMPTGGTLILETANVDLTEQYAELHVPVIPGPYVMLAVSDTGTGMTPAIKARIFEPFFTTKERNKGTGLGLSTVYGIVKQSGGYIWVYTEPGRGTTFKVYLPRVDAPAQEPTQRRDMGSVAGTETILLAEDDAMLRPLAKELLEKLGYTVLDAANTEEALGMAGRHGGPIHLLVADVVMPGTSGRELARRLADSHPDTKVLFVSGYTDDAIVHHGMLEPGLNFLQKPFTPPALARKVREVLDAR